MDFFWRSDFYPVVEEILHPFYHVYIGCHEPVCSSGTGFQVVRGLRTAISSKWPIPAPHASEFHRPVLGVGRGDLHAGVSHCRWSAITGRVMVARWLHVQDEVNSPFPWPSLLCTIKKLPLVFRASSSLPYFSLLSEKDSFTHTSWANKCLLLSFG